MENQVRTLVIHPRDPATDFLQVVYRNLTGYTLIRGDVNRAEIIQALQGHDRLILMGRGNEKGLYSAGAFDTSEKYILDDSMFPWLYGKQNIFIWSHADLFAFFNHLQGFFTGRFILKMEKAIYFQLMKATFEAVEESNQLFVSELSDLLHLSPSSIYTAICESYGRVADSNVVVKYNLERLRYLTGTEFIEFKRLLNQDDNLS